MSDPSEPVGYERQGTGKRVEMSEAQLKELVSEIAKQYDDKLAKAETLIERYKIQLEKVQKIAEAKAGPDAERARIRVIRSFNPPDHMEATFKPHKTESDKHYRGISTRPDILALRRAQGWEPVLDEQGNEVRFGDVKLAKMHESKYQETVAQPKREKQAIQEGSAVQTFKDMAESHGIKVEGPGVTYDKVEE